MKRCLSLLLSGVLIFGILPANTVSGYEESDQIITLSEEAPLAVDELQSGNVEIEDFDRGGG